MEQNVKKRNIMIFNIVMALVIFVFDLIYLNIGTLVMKGITSGLFFVLGLANFIFGIKNNQTKTPTKKAKAKIKQKIYDANSKIKRDSNLNRIPFLLH